MTRRGFLIGLSTVIIICVSLNFIKEVILYNPRADIGGGEKASAKAIIAAPSDKPAWGKNIVKRNLFNPLRESHQPTDVLKPISFPQKGVDEFQRPDVTLKGVVLNQSGVYKAYIQKDNKGKPAAVKRGEIFDNLRIIEIEDRSVDARWKDDSINLQIGNIIHIEK